MAQTQTIADKTEKAAAVIMRKEKADWMRLVQIQERMRAVE